MHINYVIVDKAIKKSRFSVFVFKHDNNAKYKDYKAVKHKAYFYRFNKKFKIFYYVNEV